MERPYSFVVKAEDFDKDRHILRLQGQQYAVLSVSSMYADKDSLLMQLDRPRSNGKSHYVTGVGCNEEVLMKVPGSAIKTAQELTDKLKSTWDEINKLSAQSIKIGVEVDRLSDIGLLALKTEEHTQVVLKMAQLRGLVSGLEYALAVPGSGEIVDLSSVSSERAIAQ